MSRLSDYSGYEHKKLLRCICFLAVATLCSVPGFGQIIWEQERGNVNRNEFGRGLITTQNGRFLAMSMVDSSSVLFTQFDSLGNVLWTKGLSKQGALYQAQRMSPTADGGAVLCGPYQDAQTSGSFLARINGNGDTLWTDIKLSHVESVIETSDGNYVTTGESSTGAYILKEDTNRNMVWNYSAGFPSQKNGHIVIEASNGDLLIGGQYGNIANLWRLSGNGVIKWENSYDHDGGDCWISFLLERPNGQILMGGETVSSSLQEQMWVTAIDSSGNQLWSESIGASDIDYALGFTEKDSTGFLAVGATIGVNGYRVGQLARLDTSGVLTRMDGFVADPDSEIHDIISIGFGEAIVLGSVRDWSGNWDIYIARVGQGITISVQEESRMTKRILQMYDFNGREIEEIQIGEPYIKVFSDGTVEKSILIGE